MSADVDSLMVHILRNGEKTGPFTVQLVQSRMKLGLLSSEDLGWHKGQADWQPLRVLLDLDIPPPPPATRSPRLSDASGRATFAIKLKPYGVRGWLLVFVIDFLASPIKVLLAWALSSHVLALLRMQSAGASVSAAYELEAVFYGNLVLSPIFAMLWFVVGVKLLRKAANALLWFRRVFWIAAVSQIVSCIIWIRVLGIASLGSIIGAFVGSVLLWLYFSRSRRVANTFGPWKTAAYATPGKEVSDMWTMVGVGIGVLIIATWWAAGLVLRPPKDVVQLSASAPADSVRSAPPKGDKPFVAPIHDMLVPDLIFAAQEGNPDAQFELAERYYSGEGIAQDFAEARRWYGMAAMNGKTVAEDKLRFFKFPPTSVPATPSPQSLTTSQRPANVFDQFDKPPAASANTSPPPKPSDINLGFRDPFAPGSDETLVRSLKSKAENGDADAQYNLALAYYSGTRVNRDHAEAIKWSRKAAEQGHVAAQSMVGVAYEKGDGVSVDLVEAVKWFRLAAEQGDARAQVGLGNAYALGEGVAKNLVLGATWFRKAAEQNDAEGQGFLGFSFYLGEGVPQDYAEAVKWFRLAAQQGDPYAQYLLAVCYRDGKGVSRNFVEAGDYFRRAAEQGHPEAKTALAALTAPSTTPDAPQYPSASSHRGDLAQALANSFKTWTSSDGRIIKARFLKIEGANVSVQRDDGAYFSIPLNSLSRQSQAQAKNLSR